MGNASSQGRDGAVAGQAQPDDLYEVLGIESDATIEEIKRAFRKLALREHPDKRPDAVQEATKRFAAIQQAYEVLSDDQERAWYDSHRTQIRTSSSQPQEFDVHEARQGRGRSSISAAQLMRFFDVGSFSGFDDSANGFFTVFRELFGIIAADEAAAVPYMGEPPLGPALIYPSFGTSETSYDEGPGAVKRFYAAWANFSSRRSFAEYDMYRSTDAPDRRIRRAMEKENKRVRYDIRRDFNDTIRSLASFIKRRDPRFSNSLSSDPMKARALHAEQAKSLAFNAAVQREAQRARAAQEYRDQQAALLSGSDSDNQLSSSGDEDDEEAVEEIWCPACETGFLSAGAWENHERSRKHKKNLQRLRRQMERENEDLDLDNTNGSLDLEPVGVSQPHEVTDTLPIEDFTELKVMDDGSDSSSASDGQIDLPRPGLSKKQKRRRAQIARAALSAGGSENDECSTGNNSHTLDSSVLVPDKVSSHVAKDISAELICSPPSHSKRDKRRAKEAMRKAQTESPDDAILCNVCAERFGSRTKLFAHINASGHALAVSATNSGGKKKGKR